MLELLPVQTRGPLSPWPVAICCIDLTSESLMAFPSSRGEGAPLSLLKTNMDPSTSDSLSTPSVVAYPETPSSPPPRDRFDADMKLAQLNFDQRTEMRQMVHLSTSALNEMVGLTAEELNIADDDEDEDELEAEAAVLREKATTKHYYESALKSYRVRSCALVCVMLMFIIPGTLNE